MNPFDIIIIVVLGFCFIRGIFRGLIKEVSSIIGVIGGYYIAYNYYLKIALPLAEWNFNAQYCKIIAFMLIFCIVFTLISLLGVLIKYLFNIAYLGLVDRICGALFGIIRGLLIVSVLLVVLTSFLHNGDIIKNSIISPHLILFSENMAKVIPYEMKNKFIVKIEEFKKKWGIDSAKK